MKRRGNSCETPPGGAAWPNARCRWVAGRGRHHDAPAHHRRCGSQHGGAPGRPGDDARWHGQLLPLGHRIHEEVAVVGRARAPDRSWAFAPGTRGSGHPIACCLWGEAFRRRAGSSSGVLRGPAGQRQEARDAGFVSWWAARAHRIQASRRLARRPASAGRPRLLPGFRRLAARYRSCQRCSSGHFRQPRWLGLHR